MLSGAIIEFPELLHDRAAYKQRLQAILPQALTGTTDTANEIAAAAAFTCMYVGAIDGLHPIRPSTVVWMSDAAAGRRSHQDRRAWYSAAMRNRARVAELLQSWGASFEAWYAADTRESIRDQTFRAWLDNGAMLVDSP